MQREAFLQDIEDTHGIGMLTHECFSLGQDFGQPLLGGLSTFTVVDPVDVLDQRAQQRRFLPVAAAPLAEPGSDGLEMVEETVVVEHLVAEGVSDGLAIGGEHVGDHHHHRGRQEPPRAGPRIASRRSFAAATPRALPGPRGPRSSSHRSSGSPSPSARLSRERG